MRYRGHVELSADEALLLDQAETELKHLILMWEARGMHAADAVYALHEIIASFLATQKEPELAFQFLAAEIYETMRKRMRAAKKTKAVPS
jgi:hypothetical protein